ncbi:tryptophan synthase subunit alpha, partial [Parageobacillus sp. SY1]
KYCVGVVICNALVQKIEQLNDLLQTEEKKEEALAEFRRYARSLTAPLR